MPERATERPRLYTIPSSAPFLTTLVRAICAGDLPLPGGAPPDPLTLPLTTIYLPTRRAARGLREAFLAEAQGALLLPSIRTLGDPDEERALIYGAEDGEGGALEGAAGAPAIQPLPRRLALMRFVQAFANRPEAGATEAEIEATRWMLTPGQASRLAQDLASLMDLLEQEEVELDAISQLDVPQELAAHWQDTVAFLKIVTEHWPRYLKDKGLVSPVTHRNALMAQEAARLASDWPHPVIAAGSTGTVPSTAHLLEVIASLPNGAVVLPGLDQTLDEESWASLRHHPEHPQAALAELLHKLGATRSDVVPLAGTEPSPNAAARARLVSEALRPVESTERWEQFAAAAKSNGKDREIFADALARLKLLVVPTAHDEAEAIALILRAAIEQPGKTASLVTPDRALARRVAACLRRYGLAIDDSAGTPVARTLPGGLLDLLLEAWEVNFAPRELMALLKHPLVLLGRSVGDMRRAARALERGAFRDIYLGEGFAGAREALAATQGEDRRGKQKLWPDEYEAALALITDLEAAFAPLVSLLSTKHSATKFAEAHVTVAEALARDATDSHAHLWQGEAGEALSVQLAELIGAGASLAMAPSDYPDFYRSLVAGEMVRPRAPAHPRLFIWGPLEARLQQPDIVILGGLNEGVWPRLPEAGPWLSRPLREKLRLPPPERRLGLSAHDFAQGLGSPTVYLTRAAKVDGVPTVPSRWLQRLEALVGAAGLRAALAPEQPYITWARERDCVERFEPVAPPAPRPPAEARPKSLSVTTIETWIRNPYAIYASRILRLRSLKPLGTEPDAPLRGSIAHDILQEFTDAYPDTLPGDSAAKLMDVAEKHFSALGASPSVAAFWRPHFARFARWFSTTEPERRSGVARIRTEVAGALELPDLDFTLTARADRIDLREDGSVVIYDYKTGRPPKLAHVDKLYAPQLPLEAAMAAQGAFDGLGARGVAGARYIEISGRAEGGDEREAGNAAIDMLAEQALEELTALVARYADPEMPYAVARRKAPAFARAYEFDEYEQLARVKEWLTQEAEEDFA